MLLMLCTFLQLIHQTINAFNKIQFVTSIKLLHVSALGCHPEGAQHDNLGKESPLLA